jgi:hypothetical protein
MAYFRFSKCIEATGDKGLRVHEFKSSRVQNIQLAKGKGQFASEIQK